MSTHVFSLCAFMLIPMLGLGFFLGISIGIFTNNIPGDFGAAISMTALAVVWCACSCMVMIASSIDGTPDLARWVHDYCPSCCHSFDLEHAFPSKNRRESVQYKAPRTTSTQSGGHGGVHGSGHVGAHGAASV